MSFVETHKMSLEEIKEFVILSADDCYLEMDDEEFEEICKEFREGEDTFTTDLLRYQRKIGWDMMQKEADSVIESLGTGELDYILRGYNFDDGFAVPIKIIQQKYCDIETLKGAYWYSDPEDIYEKFGSLSNAQDAQENMWESARIQLLTIIEKRIQNGEYVSTGMRPHKLYCFKQGIDFTGSPYNQISEKLR